MGNVGVKLDHHRSRPCIRRGGEQRADLSWRQQRPGPLDRRQASSEMGWPTEMVVRRPEPLPPRAPRVELQHIARLRRAGELHQQVTRPFG